MLKNLPESILGHLTKIYQNCLITGKIPEVWLDSKAIFIPKNNKVNLEDPKSYRPICLSSFLFKTLEKLIQQRFEVCKIYPNNLSDCQHGFRPNRSTLTALSEFTNEIEGALSVNKHAIAVFLDIKGAFDNMNPLAALETLECWGAQREIVKLLQFYYQNRSITAVAQDTDIKMYPTIGSAQGNVLSPLLWNCVFEKVAKILKRHKIKCIFFADDSTLIVTGHNIANMTTILQRALHQLVNRFNNINFQLTPAMSGHWRRWQELLARFVPLSTTPSDHTKKLRSPDFENFKEESPNPDTPVEGQANIYTDGSGKNNLAGSGFFIKWGKETRVGMAHNGSWYSVFLLELRAIKTRRRVLSLGKYP